MFTLTKKPSIFYLVVLIVLTWLGTSHAAPKPELWERWQKNNASSTQSVDHSLWSAFLNQYRKEENGIALIDYAKVTPSDKKNVTNYLDLLSKTPIDDLNRNEQLAFWINLYNAGTIDTILQNYPVESIRDIKSGFFSPGPWALPFLTVAGQELTLNDIEHRILRPIYKDPRLHYAVNCASIGCPNLASTAYTASNVDELLTSGARDYINHPRGVTIDDGVLSVSSIYQWFKVDFGNDDAGVIAHLKKYAKPNLKNKLDNIVSIDDDFYNWALNEKK